MRRLPDLSLGSPVTSPSTETLVYNKDQLLPNQPFPPPIFLDCADQLCSIIPFVVEVIGHQKSVHSKLTLLERMMYSQRRTIARALVS